jgi:hypothetical protein
VELAELEVIFVVVARVTLHLALFFRKITLIITL